MTLKVFISYAKEDQEHALDYFDRLTDEGAAPWLDTRKLLPGQNWEFEIDRALKEAHVVILLLSPRSVNKRGFVQREAKDAIDQLRYKKENDIYILPLVLEECEVPSYISGKLQYIEMMPSGAWERVQESLRLAADQQKIDLQRGIVAGPFRIFSEKITEVRSGYPGYDVAIEYPKFTSVQNAASAQELSMIFSGRAASSLAEYRGEMWDQDRESPSDAEDQPQSNDFWESYGIAHATENSISLTYNISYFYAGAAHGNSDFKTFNFSLINGLRQLSLHDFFQDIESALKQISKMCIKNLSKEYWERTGERPTPEDEDWFNTGAGPLLENFTRFNFGPDGLTFLFPPYQVHCYALGAWSINVSYYDLLDFLKPNGPHLLARPQ